MIPKKDCTKTVCPLCESRCQAGSTDSGFIENDGACFRCVFGKSKEQIQTLLLAKEKLKEETLDDDTPAQTLGDIEWDMGNDERCESIIVTACSECARTVPADSVLMKLDDQLAKTIHELRQAIDNDNIVSLVKAAYRVVDCMPASEVSE
ncbi:hypothetical protein [Psychrobacter sp. PAMC 21119]|uniref:hypothetical protein n=1 Tax=Psychrobacter sp. PAMC 21119 TaxID=1112209 RepID=UPI000288F6B6|nr:hypothetical protein [Psychrobacter sp. PAMC 21119]